MMPILLALIAASAILRFAPDTATTMVLRRLLVEVPAVWLSSIHRGHVLLVVALLLGGAAVVAIMGGDGAWLIGLAAPETLGWIATFEVSTYLDILVTLAFLSSTMRLRAAIGRARLFVASLRRPVLGHHFRGGAHRRTPRTHRTRVRPAKDEGGDRRTRRALHAA